MLQQYAQLVRGMSLRKLQVGEKLCQLVEDVATMDEAQARAGADAHATPDSKDGDQDTESADQNPEAPVVAEPDSVGGEAGGRADGGVAVAVAVARTKEPTAEDPEASALRSRLEAALPEKLPFRSAARCFHGFMTAGTIEGRLRSIAGVSSALCKCVDAYRALLPKEQQGKPLIM